MLNRLMGIVPNASEHGLPVEHMLEICHWVMLVLFVGWGSFFLYTIVRFRKSKHPKADYHGVTGHISSHAEFIVVLVEAALLLGLAFPLWAKRVLDIPPEQGEVMRVRAIAEQYAWNFHYAGSDGKFGAQDSSLVSPSNPLGLDPNSPEGVDDIVSKNELHAVLHKPIVIEITSKDVIHALAIPHMRVAQDAIPGSKIPLWFRPIRAGKYEIVCGQLCGAGHYAMKSHLIVETQEDFDAFSIELAQLQHPVAPAK